MSRERQGVLLCLVSAAAFGAMAVFAKFAYEAEVNVTTLLSVRFTLAALGFWAILSWRGAALPRWRRAVAGFLLGAAGYSLEAALFFVALTRIDASLAALLLYAYPAMVTLSAFLLGWERPSVQRIGALVVASTGVALVLSAGGDFDSVGAILALGAALSYTLYILASDRTVRGVEPLTLSTLVCTGAASTFTAFGVASGQLHLGFEPWGWAPLLALTFVSTLLSIGAFFAGVSRVGASTASILATVEPPVTVLLAWLFLGERLGPLQVLGGALVLSAVVMLQLRRRAMRVEPPPDAVALPGQ